MSPSCPAAGTCKTGKGCPKYGDYNGIACGPQKLFVSWAAATPPPNFTASGFVSVFFDTITVLPLSEDFSMTLDQPTITTTIGTKVKVTLNVARAGGFAGTVTIGAPSNLPRGIIVGLDPSTPVSGDSLAFKVKVKGSAVSGNYPLVFTGMDDTGHLSHTVTLTLNVQ